MSELGDLRKLFTRCLCQLLEKMLDDGYDPMIGKDGLKHMKNSLHFEGLAQDIDLTLNGVYLDTTEDHAVFGAFWESLDPLCVWGGSWGNDGNHYAVTFGGRK